MQTLVVRKWLSMVLTVMLSLSFAPMVKMKGGRPNTSPPQLSVTEGEKAVVVSVTGRGRDIIVAQVPPKQLVLPMFEPFITVSPDGIYGTYVTAEGATPQGVSLSA